jgi:heme A synthase
MREEFHFFSLKKKYVLSRRCDIGSIALVDVVIELHNLNAYLVLLAAAVVGIWGLVLYFTKREALKPWRIALLVTVALGCLQGLFGLTMIALGRHPGTGTGLYYLHYVYGGIVALGVPLTWLSFTTNGENKRRDLLIYSVAALVLVAAGIRALMTGPN